MTIQIIKIVINDDLETGEPSNRTAYFTIQSGTGTVYSWSRGGLPLTGGIQALLDAEEAQLFADASAAGKVATATELELAGARAYYVSNPGMKTAVFDKSVAQSDTDITGLVASISGLNAAQRTGLKQLLISALLDTRVNAHDRGLI